MNNDDDTKFNVCRIMSKVTGLGPETSAGFDLNQRDPNNLNEHLQVKR